MNPITAYFDMIEKTMSKHTVRAYTKDVTRFANFFKLWDDISEISNIEKSEFRDFIYGLNLSESSANSAIRNIGAFISWLKNEQIIVSENISTAGMSGTKRYMKAPKKEIITLSDEECRKIIKSGSDIQSRFMIAFMLTTGARREEVTRVKLSDINFETGKVLLDGKGKKQRLVGMPPSIQQMMEIFMSVRDKSSEYLFYSTRSTGRNGRLSTISINNRIKDAALRAGFDNSRISEITAHALRKTCATRLAKQFPLPVVQSILGHSNIQTTMLYVGVGDASDAMVEQELGF